MNFKNLVIALVIFLSPICANALDVGVGIKGGTTGVGVDLSVAITKTVNVRFSTTSYDFGDTSEDIIISETGLNATKATFNTTLSTDFGATGLLLDWYVLDGTFHVTAGLMKNNSTINLNGNIVGNIVQFNGNSYNVSNDFVGGSSTITGNVSLGDSYESYVGIGWGRKASSDPGFSLSVEIGVMLLTPSVNLTAPSLVNIANQSTIDNDINEAEKAAADELANLDMWPVLSIGLNYAF